MKPIDDPASMLEAERIRLEYERRERELPPDKYSWIHNAERFRYARLWSHCIDALTAAGLFPLTGKRVLDVGCGRGMWMIEFTQWGADPINVAGVDLIERRVEEARRAVPASDVRLGDASRLPWPDQSFDLVTQFTVLSSILDTTMRKHVAAEMLRVLKPGGAVLSYDLAMNNFRNPNVLGIPRSQLGILFPNCTLTVRRITLAPPVSRMVAGKSWILGLALEALPFLRTHHLAVIQKKERVEFP